MSNLVSARNDFLNKNRLGVINNTVFGEFRICCIGSTVSYARISKLRGLERYKQGKAPFRYSPENFFSQSKESQAKFDPSKHFFKNTSGNKIINPKNLLFKFDENGNIKKYSENDNTTNIDVSEQQRIDSIDNSENNDNVVTSSSQYVTSSSSEIPTD
jgi:hypothetical protein